MQKKHAENNSNKTFQLFYAKNSSGQRVLIFEKWDHSERLAKTAIEAKAAIALCKVVTLSQKIKMQKKHAKNVSTRSIQSFYAKEGSKKERLIFEKWDHFENW